MDSLDKLCQFVPFANITEASRSVLAKGVVDKCVGQATVILEKGNPVSGAYVVLEGRLRVFTVTPGGTQATLYFIDPGDTCVLALNCLFNDLLYPAWVQAEQPTRVAVIPGTVYRHLFESEPGVRNLTVQTLSTLVWRLMSELEQMHACTHRERLAQFVLSHASSDGSLLMTQQQLANHLGTTREVVARLMQDFVGRGLLRTGRGRIDIVDAAGLQRVQVPKG